MEKENEKEECAETMEWSSVSLSHHTNPSSTAAFNFSIENQILRVAKLTDGRETIDAIFQTNITNDNVQKWCGGDLGKEGFIDVLADVLDAGGKLGRSTALSFLPSSNSPAITIVMKRRKKEYKIELQTESFQLKSKIQQLEQQVESLTNQVEMFKEQFTRSSFVYGSDFDDAGLLYWIGTNGGKEEWKNPHTTGKIQVTTSCPMYSGHAIQDIIGRVGKDVCWGQGEPQWFMVDLGENRQIIPTHYSLRHGYSPGWYIQNWRFEGSCDGERWTILHQGGDPPFTKGHDMKSWKVNDGCDTYFRYLRVVQTGKCSGGTQYMRISGFEVYGKFCGVP